jgi:hypothetical protein
MVEIRHRNGSQAGAAPVYPRLTTDARLTKRTPILTSSHE